MLIAPHRNNLRQIVILNPKGGCGKTTLATNLATHYALRGARPMLIDCDPLGYTASWLEKRPAQYPTIGGLRLGLRGTSVRAAPPRLPRTVDVVIVDTPVAIIERDIVRLTADADCILVPVLPSPFDIHASVRFVAELLMLTDCVRHVAVVGNRTRPNTRSLKMLQQNLERLDTPTIAMLGDSQVYAHAAEAGLGICELPYRRAKKEVLQFARIIDWLDQHSPRRASPWARFGLGRA